MKLSTLVLLLVLLLANSARAQIAAPVISPGGVEFNDDDFAALDNGQPVVTGYILEIWAPGSDTTGTNPPVAQSGQVITKINTIPIAQQPITARRIPVTTWGFDTPKGPTYVMTVKSVGPGGAVRSAVSNQFTFPLPVRLPTAVTGVVVK